MITRILFATDFRPWSIRLEEYVADLARAHASSIVVLHAIEPIARLDEDDSDLQFYEELRTGAEEKMGEVAKRFVERDQPVTTQVTIGQRWFEVVEGAEREGADLIVLGARPFSLETRRPIGTTSHQVFLAARVPVLVVRSTPEDETKP